MGSAPSRSPSAPRLEYLAPQRTSSSDDDHSDGEEGLCTLRRRPFSGSVEVELQNASNSCVVSVVACRSRTDSWATELLVAPTPFCFCGLFRPCVQTEGTFPPGGVLPLHTLPGELWDIKVTHADGRLELMEGVEGSVERCVGWVVSKNVRRTPSPNLGLAALRRLIPLPPEEFERHLAGIGGVSPQDVLRLRLLNRGMLTEAAVAEQRYASRGGVEACLAEAAVGALRDETELMFVRSALMNTILPAEGASPVSERPGSAPLAPTPPVTSSPSGPVVPDGSPSETDLCVICMEETKCMVPTPATSSPTQHGTALSRSVHCRATLPCVVMGRVVVWQVALPCGHITRCIKCAELEFSLCDVCRRGIASVQRVFW